MERGRRGSGHRPILHFGSDILTSAPEKVLAVRAAWVAQHGDELQLLLRALDRAAAYVNDPAHLDEVAALIAAPNRVGVAPPLIRATLQGCLPVGLDGSGRSDPRYMLIGRDGAARPEPVHAAWLYAQMVRWKQAPLSAELRAAARACFRPDLYDAAFGPDTRAACRPLRSHRRIYRPAVRC